MLLDIPIGVCEACFQFEAFDDEVVESIEDVVLVVEPNNANDIVNGSTTIVIADNDGMNKTTLPSTFQLDLINMQL